MGAPTALAVRTDRAEYSRLEPDRAVVTFTVTPTGSSISGETATVELLKARFNRDVVVDTATVTFGTDGVAVTGSFDLSTIWDTHQVPLVRRGMYFARATADNNALATGDSPDFRATLITTDRFRADYLHGADLTAFDVLGVRSQPTQLTGVEIREVSRGHAETWMPIRYETAVGDLVLAGTSDVGSTTTIIAWTGGGLTPSAHIGQWLIAGLEYRQVTANGTATVTVSPGFTTAPASTDPLSLRLDRGFATLSWCGGRKEKIVAGQNPYVLRKGAPANRPDPNFIEVWVTAADLPSEDVSEEVLVTKRPMNDTLIQEWIDRSISWVEDEELATFIEPTRIISDLPAGAVAPWVNADWDKIGCNVTYYIPEGAAFIYIKFPYYPILFFHELYGSLAQDRVLEIPDEWIVIGPGGNVQLVPVSLEAIGRFVGVLLFQGAAGHRPTPGFFRYDMVAGTRDTPRVLLDLVARQTAITALTVAGQAFRSGYSSQSISRDGVSESVSFTASAMFGIYSASIEEHRKWTENALRRLRGAYRGPNLLVLDG